MPEKVAAFLVGNELLRSSKLSIDGQIGRRRLCLITRAGNGVDEPARRNTQRPSTKVDGIAPVGQDPTKDPSNIHV